MPSLPSLGSAPRGLLHFIPSPASDFLGRPIIVVRLSALHDDTDDPSSLQRYLIYALEALRHQLAKQSAGGDDEKPILQCLILLDVANTSVRILVSTPRYSDCRVLHFCVLTDVAQECRPCCLVCARSHAALPRPHCCRCVATLCASDVVTKNAVSIASNRSPPPLRIHTSQSSSSIRPGRTMGHGRY